MQAAFSKLRQVYQQDAPERQTRKAGDFKKTESALPRIASPWNISFKDNLSSYLGASNPLAREVDPKKEAVWLLDNTAYRPIHVYPHRPQPFQAEYIAAYFVKETGRDISEAVADIAEKVGLKDQEGLTEKQTEERIAERLQPFADQIAPARSTRLQLPDNNRVEKLGPGGRSAVSTQTIVALAEHKDGEAVESHTLPPELLPHGAMTTYYAEPEGWLIVSDIDDTVKTTMTPSPIGILQTTFVDDPKAIPGMPELYAHVKEALNPTWFYLSASPYNLYPFLRGFLHEHYPYGPIILRDASWMDLGGFLASLTQGTEAYKSDRMVKINQQLPKRKVLAVGDSTQSDPEAYGDVCRKFPGWIKRVFIRRVEDVSEMEGTDKNTPERFERAFRGVDKSVWTTFKDPSELREAVEKLKEVK